LVDRAEQLVDGRWVSDLGRQHRRGLGKRGASNE
jgi:hypothetical protein